MLDSYNWPKEHCGQSSSSMGISHGLMLETMQNYVMVVSDYYYHIDHKHDDLPKTAMLPSLPRWFGHSEVQ